MLAARERLGQAEVMYRQALTLVAGASGTAAQRAQASALTGLAELTLIAGNVAEARTLQQQALEVYRRLSDDLGIARVRLALAALDLEQGRAASAQEDIRGLLGELHQQGDLVGEVAAQVLLGRALLAEGKVEEARREADRAAALAGDHSSPAVKLSIMLLDARLTAAQGYVDAACLALGRLTQEVLASRRQGPELEVRLALGEIELAGGRRAAGRARLESLKRDAGARGYGLLAAKAAAALR